MDQKLKRDLAEEKFKQSTINNLDKLVFNKRVIELIENNQNLNLILIST